MFYLIVLLSMKVFVHICFMHLPYTTKCHVVDITNVIILSRNTIAKYIDLVLHPVDFSFSYTMWKEILNINKLEIFEDWGHTTEFNTLETCLHANNMIKLFEIYFAKIQSLKVFFLHNMLPCIQCGARIIVLLMEICVYDVFCIHMYKCVYGR